MLLDITGDFANTIFGLLLVILGLVGLAELGPRFKRCHARLQGRRARRKAWEARRFPSWEAPAAPFYWGD